MNTSTNSICGLWTGPAQISGSTGAPSLTMYQKKYQSFCRCLEYHSRFLTRATLHDTAHDFATGIFANAPVDSTSKTFKTGHTPYSVVSFTLTNNDNSLVISGTPCILFDTPGSGKPRRRMALGHTAHRNHSPRLPQTAYRGHGAR